MKRSYPAHVKKRTGFNRRIYHIDCTQDSLFTFNLKICIWKRRELFVEMKI